MIYRDRPLITHLVHWPRSGITSLLKSIAEYGKRHHEIEVLFILSDPHELTAFRNIGCEVEEIGGNGGLFFEARKLGSYISRRSPDVLHTHSFRSRLLAGLLGSGNRPTHITTFHSNYPYFSDNSIRSWFKRNIETWALNRACHGVVGVSEAVCNDLRLHTSIPPQLMSTIHNGLPSSFMNRASVPTSDTRSALGFPADGILVLSVGRLSREKGFDILLQAFRMAGQKVQDLQLAIIGEGEERAELSRSIREQGLSDRVKLPGFQNDIGRYLDECDIYACPSRAEGFGLSVVEAMARQAPVVASRTGGIPELIEDGRTGLLVAPGRADEMADALIKLAQDKELANRLANNGYASVIERFTIEKTVRRYESLYGSLGVAPCLNEKG